VRTWLYRIATNRCLDRLRAGQRRIEGTPLSRQPPPPTSTGEVPWLEPFPDALLPDTLSDPAEIVARQEQISLAYVRALQILPPRQRVVLVLRDVLQFRAAEVAAMLETTEESVTSALKRARATLKVEHAAQPSPPAFSAEEKRVVDAWCEAFSRMDIPRMVDLLTEDAWLRMPPLPFEYRGRDAAVGFFSAMSTGIRHDRIVHTRTNGQPAYAAYGEDPITGMWHCRGLFVITLAGERVHEVTRFEPALAALAGLPRAIGPDEAV
jgi:RNA polymerase sigma-70 factor (ECF subfamily)